LPINGLCGLGRVNASDYKLLFQAATIGTDISKALFING
jgi:hypothetical protein